MNPVSQTCWWRSSSLMFHNFPNNTAALSNVCQWFMSLFADIMTQIQARVRSTSRYRTNRPFRGMPVYTVARWKIYRAGLQTTFDVVSPFATALYMHNQNLYCIKTSKVTAKVVARRAGNGLMEKSLRKMICSEAAQSWQLAQTGQGVKPKQLTKAVERGTKLLTWFDYDLDDVMDKITGAGDAQVDQWLCYKKYWSQQQNRLSSKNNL